MNWNEIGGSGAAANGKSSKTGSATDYLLVIRARFQSENNTMAKKSIII